MGHGFILQLIGGRRPVSAVRCIVNEVMAVLSEDIYIQHTSDCNWFESYYLAGHIRKAGLEHKWLECGL